MQRLTSLLAALLAAVSISAASVASAQTSQPQVTSQRQGAQVLEEYRLDGRLYAIRIIPDDGAAYFLVDTSGEGNFERVDAERIEIPDWVSNG